MAQVGGFNIAVEPNIIIISVLAIIINVVRGECIAMSNAREHPEK